MKNGELRSGLLVFLLTCSFTGLARSDSVRLANGLVYDPVTVIGSNSDVIVFATGNARPITKELRQVARITLNGRVEFNAAEAHYAASEFQKAVRQYQAAQRRKGPDWLAALIRARLKQPALAKAGQEKSPSTGPTKAPGTQPASAKAVERPMDPLSCPEALADLIHGAPTPPDYSDLTSLQKEKAQKEFAEKLRAWWASRDPTGKQVAWSLQVVDVIREKSSGGLLLLGKSRNNIRVDVAFPAEQRGALEKLSRGDLAAVLGKIVSVRQEKDMFGVSAYSVRFRLRGESVGKGAKWPPPETLAPDMVRFCGLRQKAQDVVYLVDRSGSMLDTFHDLKRALLESVGALSAEQRFHVIFFASGPPKENPPRRLVYGTVECKREAAAYVRTIQAQGQTDPIPALERAFAVLKQTPNSKRRKLIYLLTDAEFPDNEKALAAIRSMNTGKQVHINTILHHHRSPEAMKVLRAIASENGGKFKFVEPNE